MKTKEEITSIIAKKLYPAHLEALTFNDLKSVVTALNSPKQAKLTDAVLTGKDAAVGAFLREEMQLLAESLALAEAQSLMADDSLTLAELQLIF